MMLLLHVWAFAAGVAMLILPDFFAERSSRRHSRRLAELRRGAVEAFFEERRGLEVYPPTRNPTILRFFGGVMAVGGLIGILSA